MCMFRIYIEREIERVDHKIANELHTCLLDFGLKEIVLETKRKIRVNPDVDAVQSTATQTKRTNR